MTRRVAIVVSLALGAAACTGTSDAPKTQAAQENPTGTAATLARVLDGDSIEVESDGRLLEVRLIGINAPEGDECFGDRSRRALRDALTDAELELVAGTDAESDRYERLLRYVYVDGENVNGRMLAEGNAVTLQGDHRYAREFVAIGDAAANGAYGMWAPDACGPPPPPGATIVDVEFNPPGPDDERLDAESVTIGNESTTTLDLSGWTLRDESSQNRYVFGALALARGDRVTVRSGCGTDTAKVLHWCADRSVWSNGGDTVILQGPNGNVVDRWTYRGDG